MSSLPNIITGKELMELLAEQWGGMIPISLELDVNDTCKKTQFIRVTCNGCNTSRRIAAQEILNLYQEGKVCECGYPSNMNDGSVEDTSSVESIFNNDVAKTSDDEEKESIESENPSPEPDPESIEESTDPDMEEPELKEDPLNDASESEDVTESEEQQDEQMTDEELSDALSDAFEKIENIVGYEPYDAENVLEDESTGTIEIRCLNCGNLLDYPDRKSVFEPCRGIDSPVSLEGMCNGKFGEDEYHHNCPSCIKSLVEHNGINKFLLERLNVLCNEKHVKPIITDDTKLISVNSYLGFEGDNGVKFESSMKYLEHVDSNQYIAVEEKPKPQKKETVTKIDARVEEELAKLSEANRPPQQPKAEVVKKNNSIVDETNQKYEVDSNDEFDQLSKEEDQKYEASKVFGQVISDEPFCPYEDPTSTLEDFYQSDFGALIGIVSEKTGIPFTVRCDTSTLDIPIVDFPGGIRIVCVNLNEPGQLNLPESFDNYVPHVYERDKSNMTKLFLYSDSVKFRFKATEKALTKRLLVANNTFDPARVVTLGADDKTIVYTTNPKTVNEFEKMYGLQAYGKPAIDRLLIIDILKDQKSEKDQDLVKLLLNSKPSMNDLNMHGVASIRWLTETSVDGSVKYTITDYIEHGLTVIKDGLFMCLIALSKEHDQKYPGQPYSFEVEYDRSSLMSPSIQDWLEEGGLLKNPFVQYEASYCWIKSPDDDVRISPQDEQRQDRRLFGVMTMISRFGKTIRENGVNVKDERQRRRFIKDLGYTRCEQPPIIKLTVNPMEVFAMEYNLKKFTMMKIDPNAMFAAGGINENGEDPNAEFQRMMMMQTMMSAVSNPEPVEQNTVSTEEPSSDDDMMNMFMMMAFMNNM